MQFDPVFAEKRFGYGLSPEVSPPVSVEDMLAAVQGPDLMAQRFPVPGLSDYEQRLLEFQQLGRRRRQAETAEIEQQIRKEQKAFRRRMFETGADLTSAILARRIHTPDGFRERLVSFWGDHFTVTGRSAQVQQIIATYQEEAIRPFIAGRFEDMLIAAVTHPLMLLFLDQTASVGPNSRFAQKHQGRGLNENLAREVLELHTLGVGAGYTQDDVRQLAELFTGLSYNFKTGFRFLPFRAEPGDETVLGQTYGAGQGKLDDIHAALRDLARHPATAQHIARKLAVHFVSDAPDPELVDALEQIYLASNGDLSRVYETLLKSPHAWKREGGNIKPPVDFISSAMRALAISPDRLDGLLLREVRGYLIGPLKRMGQAWQNPPGPDGWAEADEVWATPQGQAGRLQWAMLAPTGLMQGNLPDPRKFVRDALGDDVPGEVAFAAKAAETRRDGVAIVLMSPAFQRR